MVEVLNIVYRNLHISQEVIQKIDQIHSNLLSKQLFFLNLNNNAYNDLVYLTSVDANWVKIINPAQSQLFTEVSQIFDPLANFLSNWTLQKAKNQAICDQNIPVIKDIIQNTRKLILSLILLRKPSFLPDNPEERAEILKSCRDFYFNIAKNLIKNSFEKLDVLIFRGKFSIYRDQVFGNQMEINADQFFSSLSKDLFLFDEGGLSELYITEIKTKYRIGNRISLVVVDRMFFDFYSSPRNLVNVINRNYQYKLLDFALESQGLPYIMLQEYTAEIPSMAVKVTNSRDGKIKGKEFLISSLGLRESPRYCGDKIVTIGRNCLDEFTNDINIDCSNIIDSIFCFIYCNRYGYQLVDVSNKGCVRKKIPENQFVELIENNIVMFGVGSEFIIRYSASLGLNGCSYRYLTLIPLSDSAANEKVIATEFNYTKTEYNIGRADENDLVIKSKEISRLHAVLQYNELGQWFIYNKSSAGTFIYLKNANEQAGKLHSAAYQLCKGDVFFIENSLFLMN